MPEKPSLTHTPLLRCQQLQLGFLGQALAQPFDLDCHQGDRWLICAPNGTGKSQLLKRLAGEYDGAQHLAGELYYFDPQQSDKMQTHCPRSPHFCRAVSDTQMRFVGRGLSYLSAEHIIASGLTERLYFYQGPIPVELNTRIQQIAETLQITHLIAKQYRDLSSGERMLVLLARALLPNPQLLILDEVEPYLDTAHRTILGHFLHNSSQTMIAASHSHSDLFRSFTPIALMPKSNNLSVATCTLKARATEDDSSIDKALVDNTLEVNSLETNSLETNILKNNLLSEEADFLPNRLAPLQKNAIKTHPAPSDCPLMTLEQVSFCRGTTLVIDQFSQVFHRATLYWLRGANGSGKSTLLDGIFRRIYPAQGIGHDVRKAARETREITYHFLPKGARVLSQIVQQQIGYVTNTRSEAIEDGRTYDNLVVHRYLESETQQTHPLLLKTTILSAATLAAVEFCHLEACLDQPLEQLSSGQRRRVEIAKALCLPRQAILMDEPFNGLDDQAIDELSLLINKLIHRAGISIILASHEHYSVLDEAVLVTLP